jgi:MFS family permease
MNQILLIAADLVAITALVVMFFARHRRRDLVVAFLTVNVGVVAVASILGTTAVGLGVGLGLFGVLSIIRLRSTEISQHEVGYYFAALAMGLVAGLAGLATELSWVSLGLIALVLAVIGIADQPGLLRRYRHQRIVLDAAYPDEAHLTAALERMLGGRVHRVMVIELDLVNDTTTVDVKFEVPKHLGVGFDTPAAPALNPRGVEEARS